MSEITKGTVTKQVTVWCGICAQWDQVSNTVRNASLVWKRLGWTHTKKHDWRCPTCSERESNHAGQDAPAHEGVGRTAP